ncbi:alpha/beta hydrolase [Pedobacter sp. L105]|uniref:alpha/beta hydrolase n=1 Tax=Pedobacter sp. L105 TaxID=1641871 RepID=UPI00131A7CDA|nr:esterase [Pedobacter sp. L105]
MEDKNSTVKDTALAYKIREASSENRKPGLILLLHGVGSNEDDLFSLASKFPTEFVVVSARAPYTIAPGRYAWFQVDMSAGKPVINPEQAEKSRQVLNIFVKQLIELYDINADEVFIGGFSQGGIMSYSVGLTFPEKFKGIFILSSRLLPEVKPLIKPGPALAQLRVFIAHGKQDAVLRLSYADEAKDYLRGLTPNLVYHEYEMGHTINERELDDLSIWLQTSLEKNAY